MDVRLDNLQQNFRVIRQYVGTGTQVMGVVKADGYGMGVFAVVEALQQVGCQRFAVATPDEAVALREKGMADPLQVGAFSQGSGGGIGAAEHRRTSRISNSPGRSPMQPERADDPRWFI
jgi:alanine racemase